jgi:putative membrane protein
MVSAQEDSVTNIHKRWSITRINPSSYKVSISISIASAALIVTLYFLYDSAVDQDDYLYVSLFYSISAALGSSFLDYFFLRGTPTNKISKVFHVSAFANLLWSAVIGTGLAIDSLSDSHGTLTVYLLEGMLIATAFRLAIFTSVFGAGLIRALGISFVEPIIFTFVLLTPGHFFDSVNQHPASLAFGSFFVLWAVLWSILADKAGRPYVLSTFNLLQAFLTAWTEQKGDKMEKIVESKAKCNHIKSDVLRFVSSAPNQRDISVVIPGVHPGPFKPVGGSNLPYELFEFFGRSAIIVHGASDHSLNIPSKNELEKYLLSFTAAKVTDTAATCTEVVQIKKTRFVVTGIAFGEVVLIMLSTSSGGMEDVPADVSSKIQDHAHYLRFSKALVVDCHNAMGGPLSAEEQHNLSLCAREALDRIKGSQQHRFSVGYSASLCHKKNNGDLIETKNPIEWREDMGQSGLAVLAIKVNQQTYAIGWADSNNIENHVRDYVLTQLYSRGLNMVEICTSDTHYTSGKRTKQGYYPLGSMTDVDEILAQFEELTCNSFDDPKECSFSHLSVDSEIKVMGKGQFDDYSKALDKSMNLTKIFLAISGSVAFSMLLIS